MDSAKLTPAMVDIEGRILPLNRLRKPVVEDTSEYGLTDDPTNESAGNASHGQCDFNILMMMTKLDEETMNSQLMTMSGSSKENEALGNASNNISNNLQTETSQLPKDATKFSLFKAIVNVLVPVLTIIVVAAVLVCNPELIAPVVVIGAGVTAYMGLKDPSGTLSVADYIGDAFKGETGLNDCNDLIFGGNGDWKDSATGPSPGQVGKLSGDSTKDGSLQTQITTTMSTVNQTGLTEPESIIQMLGSQFSQQVKGMGSIGSISANNNDNQ
ncbi:MAG: hypothetical protein A2Z85_03410 [Chlamydiae bacterium GWA2_50_15]|nr:MAG: hypothetical protein A2Z85_03410 [Chlamydiae bacterium GWA2_50_15]